MAIIPPAQTPASTPPSTRIDPLAPPPELKDPVQNEMVSILPDKFKAVVAVLVAVAGVGSIFFGGPTTLWGAVCAVVVAAGAALGVVSSGTNRG